MTPTRALKLSIALWKQKRRDFAPEANAGRLYGAQGESIDRATAQYEEISAVIAELEKMLAKRILQ